MLKLYTWMPVETPAALGLAHHGPHPVVVPAQHHQAQPAQDIPHAHLGRSTATEAHEHTLVCCAPSYCLAAESGVGSQ